LKTYRSTKQANCWSIIEYPSVVLTEIKVLNTGARAIVSVSLNIINA